MLAEHGEDGKILGGGQTLVPMLGLRLVNPQVLVDINRIPELDFIDVSGGSLRMGALVRWHRIETDPAIAAAHPLLAHAISHVAHYQIRSRGTWAGSSAHADPAAEFPAVAVLCGAEFVLKSMRGTRILPADEFFLGLLTTALEPDEILCEVRFPPWPATRRWAFEEFAMRAGDFALGGVALYIDKNSNGTGSCGIVAFGTGDSPQRRPDAEAFLAASNWSDSAIEAAAQIAADEAECNGDLHASADYRRALIKTLIGRALKRAWTIGSETRT